MYICPICKEANEGYRNYCKECGFWLLSTNFPSKSIEKATKIKQTANNNWARNLFIIGTIVFVLLVVLSGTEFIFSWLALFGIVGFSLSAILAVFFTITKTFKMRRNGLTFLLVTSVASFIISIMFASNNLQAASTQVQPVKESSEQSIPKKNQEYVRGDTVRAGDLTYIVKDVFQQKEISGSFDTLTTNGVFLVMTVNVSNNDKQPRYVDKSMFKLHDSQGRIFEPDTKADININDDTALFLKSINPGIALEAKIVFELPADAKHLKLEVTSGLGSSNIKSQFITIGSL